MHFVRFLEDMVVFLLFCGWLVLVGYVAHWLVKKLR